METMKEMYLDAVEDLPPNIPPPRGNPVEVNCLIDSDHTKDKVKRRLKTGILLYLSSAKIIWYSKRQSIVKISTFGSEFVALRLALELIISFRYKLQMFDIPVLGPSEVLYDNKAVYKNVCLS